MYGVGVQSEHMYIKLTEKQNNPTDHDLSCWSLKIITIFYTFDSNSGYPFELELCSAGRLHFLST